MPAYAVIVVFLPAHQVTVIKCYPLPNMTTAYNDEVSNTRTIDFPTKTTSPPNCELTNNKSISIWDCTFTITKITYACVHI